MRVEVKHEIIAKKPHWCKGCGHTIQHGYSYSRVKIFSGDGITSYATHEECMWITNLFSELFGVENDEYRVSSAKQIAVNMGWRFYLEKCRQVRDFEGRMGYV